MESKPLRIYSYSDSFMESLKVPLSRYQHGLYIERNMYGMYEVYYTIEGLGTGPFQRRQSYRLDDRIGPYLKSVSSGGMFHVLAVTTFLLELPFEELPLYIGVDPKPVVDIVPFRLKVGE